MGKQRQRSKTQETEGKRLFWIEESVAKQVLDKLQAISDRIWEELHKAMSTGESAKSFFDENAKLFPKLMDSAPSLLSNAALVVRIDIKTRTPDSLFFVSGYLNYLGLLMLALRHNGETKS